MEKKYILQSFYDNYPLCSLSLSIVLGQKKKKRKEIVNQLKSKCINIISRK